MLFLGGLREPVLVCAGCEVGVFAFAEPAEVVGFIDIEDDNGVVSEAEAGAVGAAAGCSTSVAISDYTVVYFMRARGGDKKSGTKSILNSGTKVTMGAVQWSKRWQ